MERFNQYQFIACDAPKEEAEIVLFGAPYDGTSSFRPGSRFAPSRVRIDSYGLETYSPFLDRDLEDKSIHDWGDLSFPFGNREQVLDTIYQAVQGILGKHQKPLMIGGEHLVTLPAIRAMMEQYPDLVVFHLDAHTDLRTEYMGEPFSHATVIRNVWDLLGDGRIFQFGIRSGLREEFQWAKAGHTFMNPFGFERLEEAIQMVQGRPVYLTIDLDVLDPSIFPGTGTPEPGGITFKELMTILQRLTPLNLVGADVVELAPDYDPTGVSIAVACKVIREVLLLL